MIIRKACLPPNILDALKHTNTEQQEGYISNATETGAIYKKKELVDLSVFCKSKELLLYLDGARIGCALCSDENDVTLSQLSELVDVFYIGGTKNGAMLGEAVIINNNSLKEGFRFCLKQKGALLAKSRILGLQFVELFKEEAVDSFIADLKILNKPG